jgi:uracil-DNA glycosylase family 4
MEIKTINEAQKRVLQWYQSQGIQEVLLNAPQNRYALVEEKKPTLTPVNQHSATSSTEHPAWSCHTLSDLQQAMKEFTGCGLKDFAQNTVFADGNPKASIMLVGEAPGADEDKQGLPFVGQSGQLLDKAFAAIGLDRTKMYISNIIPWRPPGNRPPTTLEVAACQPFIERHIELIAPKILIFVGGVSTKTLLNTADGITRLRGKWISYKPRESSTLEIQAMPVYHPAYLLRSPGQKSIFWNDLLNIEKKILDNNIQL